MSYIDPKTALISLSDKTNLKKITDNVIEVSDFTGFEEMMDGRV